MSYPSFLQDCALINTDDEIWVEPEFYSEMRFDLVAPLDISDIVVHYTLISSSK